MKILKLFALSLVAAALLHPNVALFTDPKPTPLITGDYVATSSYVYAAETDAIDPNAPPTDEDPMPPTEPPQEPTEPPIDEEPTEPPVDPDTSPTDGEPTDDPVDPVQPPTDGENTDDGIVDNVLSKLENGWKLYVVPLIASLGSNAVVLGIVGLVIRLIAKRKGKKDAEVLEKFFSGVDGVTGKFNDSLECVKIIADRLGATEAEQKRVASTVDAVREDLTAQNTAFRENMTESLASERKELAALISTVRNQLTEQNKAMRLAWTTSDALPETKRREIAQSLSNAEQQPNAAPNKELL